MANRDIVDAPIPAGVEKASLFEDFIDIFFSPSKVFARRANSGFLIITLVLTVIAAAFAFANRGTVEAAMEHQFRTTQAEMMEQNPNMTEEQLGQMRKYGTMFGKAVMYVAVPFMVILYGVVVWIVAKIFGAGMSYSQSAMVVAYSLIPATLLGALIFTIQGLMMDASVVGFYGLALSPARFMDPATTSQAILGLLTRLEIFTLWMTILCGIGIAVLGRLPREKGYMAAALIWVVGTIPALIGLLMG